MRMTLNDTKLHAAIQQRYQTNPARFLSLGLNLHELIAQKLNTATDHARKAVHAQTHTVTQATFYIYVCQPLVVQETFRDYHYFQTIFTGQILCRSNGSKQDNTTQMDSIYFTNRSRSPGRRAARIVTNYQVTIKQNAGFQIYPENHTKGLCEDCS